MVDVGIVGFRSTHQQALLDQICAAAGDGGLGIEACAQYASTDLIHRIRYQLRRKIRAARADERPASESLEMLGNVLASLPPVHQPSNALMPALA
jgi:hypothetical protein